MWTECVKRKINIVLDDELDKTVCQQNYVLRSCNSCKELVYLMENSHG